MAYYFLEIKDKRGGLLVEIESEMTYKISFSFSNSMKFSKRLEAVKFLRDHKIEKSFRIIFYNGD